MKKHINKLINIAQFRQDCGCKSDFDFPLIECLSRLYDTDEPSAYVGFYIPCELVDDYAIDHVAIIEDELFAENIDELHIKIRNWYKDNYIKALKIVLGE